MMGTEAQALRDRGFVDGFLAGICVSLAAMLTVAAMIYL